MIIKFSILFVLLAYYYPIQANESQEISGMYSYMADTGLFSPCGEDKKHLPVALEGDNIALQRAYLKNRYQPGKSLLVTIKAHIAARPKMEGEGKQSTIIVDKFINIHQQERCTGIVPPSSLTNTYWKLVELKGERLDNNEIWLHNQGNSRDIHFIIHQNNKLKGFAGCNRFSGKTSYTDKQIKLDFLLHNNKTCPAISLEKTIINVWSNADSYSIKGESLQLYNKNKQTIARFIAIYF